jgi:type I restriction enzyme, S subunit
MSERVPEGWEETNLSRLVSVDADSLKGSTNPEYKFKYIDISCVSTGEVKPPSQHILFQNAPSRAKRIVRKNDVLVATVRPNLKAFAHFDEEGEDWIASTGFAVLRYKEQADSRFIYNVMLSDDVSRQIEKLVAGSNYPAINSSDIKELSVLSPPLPEQKKIASILTSVDDVIETTQKQIDKLQDLKKATMNELLTRGIGHTEFKESEWGRIPKSWEVHRFGEISRQKTLGTTERGGGDVVVPLIKMGDIQSGKVLTKENEKVSKSKLIAQNFLSNGDFLFNTRNTPELVGKVGNYNSNKTAAYDNNLLKIDFLDGVSSLFMGIQFNESNFKKRLKTLVAGTTSVAAIYWNDLSRFRVLKPNIAEQNEMTSIILSIDKQIDDQINKLSQTQSLKKSLMQDLLTGKIRVQVN